MASGHVTRVRKLFKLILRLHRNLPSELRVLGDIYVKDEFKRHKNCKPQEAHSFLQEWQDYAARILRQVSPMQANTSAYVTSKVAFDNSDANVQIKRAPMFGDNLSSDDVVGMSPDQLYNLYMLLANARGVDPLDPDNTDYGPLDVDTYVNKIKDARNDIIKLEKIEKDKMARGLIKKEDTSFNSAQWVQLFDLAVEMKDVVDMMNAIAKTDKSDDKAEKAFQEKGEIKK